VRRPPDEERDGQESESDPQPLGCCNWQRDPGACASRSAALGAILNLVAAVALLASTVGKLVDLAEGVGEHGRRPVVPSASGTAPAVQMLEQQDGGANVPRASGRTEQADKLGLVWRRLERPRLGDGQTTTDDAPALEPASQRATTDACPSRGQRD
jgi:hypothetical protein